MSANQSSDEKKVVSVMRYPVKLGSYIVDFGSRTLKLNLLFVLIVAVFQIPEMNAFMESFGGKPYEIFLNIKFWLLAIMNMWLRLKTISPALIKESEAKEPSCCKSK